MVGFAQKASGIWNRAPLRYLFENCVLDTDRRELRRGTNLVAVEPQVFDLLVISSGTGSAWSARTICSPPSGRGVSFRNRRLDAHQRGPVSCRR